jgi:transposase-like protein
MTTQTAPAAPPHCPNPACAFHQRPHGWRFQRDGFHARLAPPHRVQRYRCCHCRRRFSDQTFRQTYWLKRPGSYAPIAHGLLGGSCLRQLGRSLGLSPQTVLRHANRLGRQCALFHEQHRPQGEFTEPLALDGFVSFEYSQFHPTSYHLLTGSRSHFCHGFTVSEQRRSGRMTRRQKRQRRELEERFGRPDPRAVEKDVAELVRIVGARATKLVLHSDEHADYPTALKAVPHLAVEHHTTSSRVPRTPMNPLFPCNLVDLLIRHSGANHKRETIAFPKRRQMAIWRLQLFVAWRNYVKWTSERRHRETPAMSLGLTDRRIPLEEMLERRQFPSRTALPPRWQEYYWGRVRTREVPNGRDHRLTYAA